MRRRDVEITAPARGIAGARKLEGAQRPGDERSLQERGLTLGVGGDGQLEDEGRRQVAGVLDAGGPSRAQSGLGLRHGGADGLQAQRQRQHAAHRLGDASHEAGRDAEIGQIRLAGQVQSLLPAGDLAGQGGQLGIALRAQREQLVGGPREGAGRRQRRGQRKRGVLGAA